MGCAANWSTNELQYLEDSWGTVSVKGIAKSLNRPVGGVINQVGRQGLGKFLECGEYISTNQLYKALGRPSGSGYTIKHWIEKQCMPVKYKKKIRCNHSNYLS